MKLVYLHVGRYLFQCIMENSSTIPTINSCKEEGKQVTNGFYSKNRFELLGRYRYLLLIEFLTKLFVFEFSLHFRIKYIYILFSYHHRFELSTKNAFLV